jgi:uncharacterized membrane-anchored protein YitT (DUF2179 family)
MQLARYIKVNMSLYTAWNRDPCEGLSQSITAVTDEFLALMIAFLINYKLIIISAALIHTKCTVLEIYNEFRKCVPYIRSLLELITPLTSQTKRTVSLTHVIHVGM